MRKKLIDYIRDQAQCNYYDLDDYFKDLSDCDDNLRVKYLVELLLYIQHQELVEEGLVFEGRPLNDELFENL